MKKLIIIVLLLLSLQVDAQNSTTRYDTCQYLSQYEGEWLYAFNQDTIKIYLRAKRDYFEPHNHISDQLYGWHEYKQGNTIIESNYANRFMYLPYFSDSISTNQLPSITLFNYNCTASSNKLEGGIRDINQANERHAVKTHMWGGGNYLVYMLWKQSFVEFHGAWTGAYGMTLPKEFILVKQ
jgi:hypothetical protein